MSVDLDDEDCDTSEMSRCWMCCGREAKDASSITCGSLRCLMEYDDMTADEINHNERQVKTGMWNAAFEWCRMKRHDLSVAQRVFYTFKLWICGLFGWRSYLDYKQDPVDVANIDFHTTYAGWDHTWLRVGGGMFINWCYELAHDSDWNM